MHWVTYARTLKEYEQKKKKMATRPHADSYTHRHSQDLFMQKLKSKPACLPTHGTREKSGILNINTPIYLTPPQEQVKLNKLTEKKVGVTGHFEIIFSKNRFFLWQYILKQACCLVSISTVKRQEIWTTSSWDSLKMVSTKKLARLCSKTKTMEPPWRRYKALVTGKKKKKKKSGYVSQPLAIRMSWIMYCKGRNFRRRKISYFSVQNLSYGT